MNDNDIIKALERCGYHKECCYCNSVEECGSKRVLVANALDLINRQKAEIERFSDIGKMYNEVRAEAIREFAEKLKSHSYIVSDESQTGIINRYSVITVNQIDNLVKEMEG